VFSLPLTYKRRPLDNRVFKEPPPPNNVPDKIQPFSVPLNNEFVANAAPENLALDTEPDINGRKLLEEDELDLENVPPVGLRRRDRVAPAAAGRISPSSRPPELGKKSQHVILSLASSFSRNDVLLQQPSAGNLAKNLPKHAHKVTEVAPDAGSNHAMDRSINRPPGQSVKGLHDGKNKTSRAVTPVMSNAAAVTPAMANSSVTRKVVTHVFHKSSMLPVTLDAKQKLPTVSPTTRSLGQPPGMNQSKTNTSVPATKISNSKVSKGGKVSFNPIVTAERKLSHASTNGTAKTSDDGGKFII
jgi:hypothetical protein